MIYIEAYRSSATVTLTLDVGSQLPIATTSMGRALLCALPERERESLMEQMRIRDEVRWPKIRVGIEQAMKDYEEKGLCFSLGEWKKDVHAVAAPLIPSNGSRILVFSCAGAAFQLRRHMLEDDIGPRVAEPGDPSKRRWTATIDWQIACKKPLLVTGERLFICVTL